jgi:hypothetical protein
MHVLAILSFWYVAIMNCFSSKYIEIQIRMWEKTTQTHLSFYYIVKGCPIFSFEITYYRNHSRSFHCFIKWSKSDYRVQVHFNVPNFYFKLMFLLLILNISHYSQGCSATHLPSVLGSYWGLSFCAQFLSCFYVL